MGALSYWKPAIFCMTLMLFLDEVTMQRENNDVTDEGAQNHDEKSEAVMKPVGMFIAVAVALFTLMGIIYCIYNRSSLKSQYSHQQLKEPYFNDEPDLTIYCPDSSSFYPGSGMMPTLPVQDSGDYGSIAKPSVIPVNQDPVLPLSPQRRQSTQNKLETISAQALQKNFV